MTATLKYSLRMLRVGCTLSHPSGLEIYFQPGDQATEICTLYEAVTGLPPDRIEAVADMLFSPYFERD